MPGLEEAFERIGEAAEHHLPQTHAAGIAIAVTDTEELLGVVVRGMSDVAAGAPVRPETRFEIGSISKSFAGIVCVQEAEAGRLDLGASINDLLPWLELPEPYGPITLDHLMTHVAGLATGTEESPTGPGALTIARTLAPAYAPGEHWWYSNDGWKLVGAALERATGSTVPDLLHERILAPLGMSSSQGAIDNQARLDLAIGYEPAFDDRPPHLGHPLVPARWLVTSTADGAIVSNVIDMAAYARMLLGRGSTLVDGHEVTILEEAGYARLALPRVATEDPDEPGERYGYGLATSVHDGRTYVGHSGGMVGYTALLLVDPDAGIGAVALQNGGGDKGDLVRYALQAVRSVLGGDEPAPMPHPAAPGHIERASALAGAYIGPRRIELAATGDGGLRLHDGAIGVELERWPGSDHAFCVPHPARDRFLLRAAFDDGGRVTGLVHGRDRFVPEGAPAHEEADAPTGWAAFEGLYRSNDPWSPVLRVFVRGERPWLLWPWEGVEEPLTPLDDGAFAVGDTWTPRRIRFEEILDGRACVAVADGGRWYRASED